jgi:hypothetical protein
MAKSREYKKVNKDKIKTGPTNEIVKPSFIDIDDVERSNILNYTSKRSTKPNK